jgi:hypothetical protein
MLACTGRTLRRNRGQTELQRHVPWWRVPSRRISLPAQSPAPTVSPKPEAALVALSLSRWQNSRGTTPMMPDGSLEGARQMGHGLGTEDTRPRCPFGGMLTAPPLGFRPEAPCRGFFFGAEAAAPRAFRIPAYGRMERDPCVERRIRSGWLTPCRTSIPPNLLNATKSRSYVCKRPATSRKPRIPFDASRGAG